jgi:hypothetical protein
MVPPLALGAGPVGAKDRPCELTLRVAGWNASILAAVRELGDLSLTAPRAGHEHLSGSSHVRNAVNVSMSRYAVDPRGLPLVT